ncbi:MAG: OsmC family protein [Candidatus Omnitrophota bacterium]|nr:OsmC family protein [Candidatus Omnitrophota bacterium]
MYEVDVDYENSFHYKVTSLNYEIKVDSSKPSGAIEGITPPALLLASLGSCAAVYLERYLSGAKIKFDKFTIKVKSEICPETPHYLKNIALTINLPGLKLEQKRYNALLEFIRNCPVHNTLKYNPAVDIILEEK